MIPELSPDCGACTALCCVGPAFDESEDFAIDKPAGHPCPNLDGYRCSIHETLESDGFRGCVLYDCAGAGQRAVALHDGADWRRNPAILRPVLESFRHLRRIHEQIGLLKTAASLPLSAEEDRTRLRLLSALCPDEMNAARAEALATGPVPGEVRFFLRSLAHHT